MRCLDIKTLDADADRVRTTLTLDDDLAGLLKERARQRGVSFREVVNQTLRAGLGSDVGKAASRDVRTIPHSFGFKPGIDLDKLNQVADELEAESVAASLRKQGA